MDGNYVVKLSFFSYIIFLAHQLFDNVDIFDYVKITFIVVYFEYVISGIKRDDE